MKASRSRSRKYCSGAVDVRVASPPQTNPSDGSPTSVPPVQLPLLRQYADILRKLQQVGKLQQSGSGPQAKQLLGQLTPEVDSFLKGWLGLQVAGGLHPPKLDLPSASGAGGANPLQQLPGVGGGGQ